MMSINVAVVDDGSVAIRGAVDVLRGCHLYCFAGAFPTLAEAVSGQVGTEPVVLVLDPFTAPNGSLAEVPTVPGHVTMLIMSASTQPATVRQALHAGARGYIGKEADVATLLAAVSAVGVGGMYLSRQLNDVLMKSLDGVEGAVPVADLTPRERDVLVMVAQGLTHKQIGTRLMLSKATVDTYVHRVRQKVGSVNKAGLTRFAMDLNLLGGGGQCRAPGSQQ
jgi:two-component system nitrate/nitrite response regulator NarL